MNGLKRKYLKQKAFPKKNLNFCFCVWVCVCSEKRQTKKYSLNKLAMKMVIVQKNEFVRYCKWMGSVLFGLLYGIQICVGYYYKTYFVVVDTVVVVVMVVVVLFVRVADLM